MKTKRSDVLLPIKDVAKMLGYSEGGICCFLTKNKVPRKRIAGVYYHNYTIAKKIKDHQDKMKIKLNLSLRQKRAKVIKIYKKDNTTSIRKIIAKTGASDFSIKKWIKEYKNETAEKKPESTRIDPFKLMASSLGY